MIQLDEKLPEPPAYSNVDTLYPPPPQQSPTATGQSQTQSQGQQQLHPNQYAPSPSQPTVPPQAYTSPQGYPSPQPVSPPTGYPPSPASGVPLTQQQPQSQRDLPSAAQMEAQIGSQYQQACMCSFFYLHQFVLGT